MTNQEGKSKNSLYKLMDSVWEAIYKQVHVMLYFKSKSVALERIEGIIRDKFSIEDGKSQTSETTTASTLDKEKLQKLSQTKLNIVVGNQNLFYKIGLLMSQNMKITLYSKNKTFFEKKFITELQREKKISKLSHKLCFKFADDMHQLPFVEESEETSVSTNAASNQHEEQKHVPQTVSYRPPMSE